MEFCESNQLAIANTFVLGSPEEKVTYAEPGSPPLGEITEAGYNMLDILSCDNATLSKFVGLGSIRNAVLATDHYLGKASILFERPWPKT